MATNEIETHIKALATLARSKWGEHHKLVELKDMSDHWKCTKCGIEYVAYHHDAIMKLECELWKRKLMRLISDYK